MWNFAPLLIATVVATVSCSPQRRQFNEDSQPAAATRYYNQPNLIPQGFRNVAQEEPDNYPVQSRRPSSFQNLNDDDYQPSTQTRKTQYKSQVTKEELEEEKEEPDRLSVLLPNSKFDCHGKGTGYYADDSLQCEVFHYCQDNSKHSWVCPEGFTFHQVHLICMPPSGDNICQKSSQFHFVNEYLYKPLNYEEAQNKPNVTLRYSDRYFPDEYNYYGSHQSVENEEELPVRKQPIQVGFHSSQQPSRRPVQQVQTFSPTLRPESNIPSQFRQSSQIFRSPEEVNIPLQQRRPFASSTRATFASYNDAEIEYE